ncbi:MAG: hypothetical protein U0414_33480 [Polyangiaceae bacterium]
MVAVDAMLIARREQVAVFEAEIERRFAERMEAYVARAYPEHHESLGDEGTRRLVERGIERARSLEIDDPHAQAGLILLMVEFGEKLERSPERAWGERMLSSRDLPGPIRVSAVRARFAASTGGRRLSPPNPSPAS